MKKSPRQIAYEILLKIESEDAFSNLAIDSAVRANCPDSTDCAFISRLTYGVVERKITLDFIISKYLSGNIEKLKRNVRTILRMGVYQILFMDKVPVSAAVNESVKLAKVNNSVHSAGFINAVLRKISSDDLDFGSKTAEERMVLEYSMPLETVKFLIHHYGKETAEEFLRASLNPKKVYIKVNTTKITADGLVERLSKEGIGCEKTRLLNALEISLNDAVYSSECFKDGLFHVEDISSQLAVKALEPQKGDVVIDLCAAPGGKSFAIGECMENSGRLYSCELYPQRADLINNGAKRLGLDCIETVVNDATVFNEALPVADRVLCDVPCSGLGIIGKKPEIKYKRLDDTKPLIPIQKAILNNGAKYLKTGGRLVYSTCSVNPNENRRVCDAFLKEHPDFKTIKALPHEPRAIDEGDYLTLFPHINNCDGFFIAVFEKQKV